MTDIRPSLFSIVTPTHNRSSLVIETLESVWAQNYRPIEHVIIDDGSSDDTVAVVRRWVGTLPERDGYDHTNYLVKLIEKPNGGVSTARNLGLQHLSGQYVHYLDSDDLLEPGALQVLAEAFHATAADLIFAGFRRFDQESGETIMERIPTGTEDLVANAMNGSLWGNAGRISLRADFAQQIGPWNEDFRVFEDREYSERAVLLARRLAILRHCLVKVRVGGGSRQNDVLRSRMGRGFRIRSEVALAERAKHRDDVTESSWIAFRSRIYGLAMRSYAEGWREHGDASRVLADSIKVRLDRRGRMRYVAVLGGVLVCRLYLFVGQLLRTKTGTRR
ncbi:MAG: glycosyltransferase [Pseudomonadota bacterium]